MENGQVKINEALLNDWSSLRDLLFAYADADYVLKKDTWDWIVKKADNTFVSSCLEIIMKQFWSNFK